MSQKIIKIGSSLGVTLPKSILEKMGLSLGDKVELSVDKETKEGKFSPVVDNEKENITKLTKNFINRYRKDLESLKDK